MAQEYKRKKTRNRVYERENSIDNEKKEFINKIKFLFKQERNELALSTINQYLKEYSEDNYILTYHAMTLFKLNKVEESIKEFENILNKDSLSERETSFAMTQYAFVLSQNEQADLAIYYYEKIINESKDLELIARGKLAGIYISEKRYEDAIRILTIDGFNNEFLNVKRAYIYLNSGDYDKAIEALKEKEYNTYDVYVKVNLDDTYTQQEKNYIKGHIYYKQDDMDRALPYLSKASLCRGRQLTYKSVIDLARIYILKGEMNSAIDLCEETLKDCSSKYYVRIFYEILAKAYYKKNDYEKAEEYYKKIDTDEKIKKINLGKIELLKGNFELADEYLSNLDVDNYDINMFYEEYYILALAKLRVNKYDEVLKILDLFYENINKHEIEQMKFKLDRIRLYINSIKKEKIDQSTLAYTEKQIVSYSKKSALKHIYKHHVVEPRESKFNENIDIKELFENIKDMLSKDNVIYDSLFDKYIIKYPNAGYDKDNHNINQMLVITLPNTKNILTMYPYDGSESMFVLEELEEKEKPKVKRLSQIEKFNKKYGMN